MTECSSKHNFFLFDSLFQRNVHFSSSAFVCCANHLAQISTLSFVWTLPVFLDSLKSAFKLTLVERFDEFVTDEMQNPWNYFIKFRGLSHRALNCAAREKFNLLTSDVRLKPDWIHWYLPKAGITDNDLPCLRLSQTPQRRASVFWWSKNFFIPVQAQLPDLRWDKRLILVPSSVLASLPSWSPCSDWTSPLLGHWIAKIKKYFRETKQNIVFDLWRWSSCLKWILYN